MIAVSDRATTMHPGAGQPLIPHFGAWQFQAEPAQQLCYHLFHSSRDCNWTQAAIFSITWSPVLRLKRSHCPARHSVHYTLEWEPSAWVPSPSLSFWPHLQNPAVKEKSHKAIFCPNRASIYPWPQAYFGIWQWHSSLWSLYCYHGDLDTQADVTTVHKCNMTLASSVYLLSASI